MAFVSYASLLALKTEGGAALLEKDLRALILGALLLFLGRERERGMACARTCARGEGGVQGVEAAELASFLTDPKGRSK